MTSRRTSRQSRACKRPQGGSPERSAEDRERRGGRVAVWAGGELVLICWPARSGGVGRRAVVNRPPPARRRPGPTGDVVLGIGGEPVGDGLQIACGVGPEVRVDELVHPGVVLSDAGCYATAEAAVDEGAQARGEPVGFGEVDEVPAVWPLFELYAAHVLLETGALAGAQSASEHAQARSVDAGHRRLHLVLELTRVVVEQLLPVAEYHLPADVLAGELPGAERLGYVLESHALLEGRERVGEAVASQDRLRAPDELRQRPDVDGALDVDQAANRVRRGVDRRDAG